MKSSLTMCGQCSALISGRREGQSIGSSETTSSNCVSPDQAMYLAQPSWRGVNVLVAMYHGCICCALTVATDCVSRRGGLSGSDSFIDALGIGDEFKPRRLLKAGPRSATYPRRIRIQRPKRDGTQSVASFRKRYVRYRT